ncbi:hypothetical protein [Polynucleobacter sp. 35-46-11]|uniref:hypothetical protein n=1 Tax=Polynucleobacter sp. 35-46-11 TaxID=1970425 RepID=UPI0025F6BD00|nr:hypothetical protein [Polynucleobacter sp. 35-46-11]
MNIDFGSAKFKHIAPFDLRNPKIQAKKSQPKPVGKTRRNHGDQLLEGLSACATNAAQKIGQFLMQSHARAILFWRTLGVRVRV